MFLVYCVESAIVLQRVSESTQKRILSADKNRSCAVGISADCVVWFCQPTKIPTCWVSDNRIDRMLHDDWSTRLCGYNAAETELTDENVTLIE